MKFLVLLLIVVQFFFSEAAVRYPNDARIDQVGKWKVVVSKGGTLEDLMMLEDRVNEYKKQQEIATNMLRD